MQKSGRRAHAYENAMLNLVEAADPANRGSASSSRAW